ncbi:hypothetical protein GQ457_02G012990 [Hibiscus cannabinus]
MERDRCFGLHWSRKPECTETCKVKPTGFEVVKPSRGVPGRPREPFSYFLPKPTLSVCIWCCIRLLV